MSPEEMVDAALTPGGLRVFENRMLLVPGEPYTTTRSWRERLFSWPWRPWERIKVTQTAQPDPNLYRLGTGALIGHPETVRNFITALQGEERQWKQQ